MVLAVDLLQVLDVVIYCSDERLSLFNHILLVLNRFLHFLDDLAVAGAKIDHRALHVDFLKQHINLLVLSRSL